MQGGPVKRYETDKGILKLNDRDAERLGFKDPEPEDGDEQTTTASRRPRSTSKKRPAPAAADAE